jgi:adenylate cyclase class 2
MQLEVELKYPVADRDELLADLARLGCRWREPLDQADLYLAHPCRDFKQTDEALRLRRSGQECCITYKGPKLDATTKTRREIELPIEGGMQGQDQYRQLLEALGFRPVFEVAKTRLPGSLVWQDTEIEIALDDVAGLGTFVELEVLATRDDLPAARETLISLAGQLGLQGSERRGYLDLLLEKQTPAPTK